MYSCKKICSQYNWIGSLVNISTPSLATRHNDQVGKQEETTIFLDSRRRNNRNHIMSNIVAICIDQLRIANDNFSFLNTQSAMKQLYLRRPNSRSGLVWFAGSTGCLSRSIRSLPYALGQSFPQVCEALSVLL